MSKPVRLKEHLYIELEKLAERENRSLTNLVNHLLEQVLEMEARAGAAAHVPAEEREGIARDPGRTESSVKPTPPPAPVQADAQPRDIPARTIVPSEVKPDFKPGGKKK